MECTSLSALRVGSHSQRIRVRASRVWQHRGGLGDGEIKEIRMVLIDDKGDAVYALVPTELVAQNIRSLDEMAIYELDTFEVSGQPTYLNPVENPLVLIFTEHTNIQVVLHPDPMFPEFTYKITPIADLVESHRITQPFVDVIGVIRGISSIATLNLPTRNVAVSRRHLLIDDGSGNTIRLTLWGEAAFRFNGSVVSSLGQNEIAVAIFVGTTVHSYEGSKELAGGAACRWYINEDSEDINVLQVSALPSFRPIARLPYPRQVNLQTVISSVNYPTRPLSVLLNHNFFQNQETMFRSMVSIWRLTPGYQWWFLSCTRCRHEAMPASPTSLQPNGYICSDNDCAGTNVSLEYRLRLLGSDGTGEAEFVLIGRVAEAIIGASPRQIILNNYPSTEPITDLAAAAAQISHTPPEISAVVSCGYKFLIHVTADSFHGRWASFKVCAVEALAADIGPSLQPF